VALCDEIASALVPELVDELLKVVEQFAMRSPTLSLNSGSATALAARRFHLEGGAERGRPVLPSLGRLRVEGVTALKTSLI